MNTEEVFDKLGDNFHAGVIKETRTYYFHIGDVMRTVTVKPDSFIVEKGKTIEKADCVGKTSEEFFMKIWNEGYMPQLKDLISGAIKSNNPSALKEFLEAFHGKSEAKL
ncbi:MAG: hypothetical protein OEY64_02215 [Nitrospinota bacterium]|nr:hypothetical protein [Nitrospinota bacterium]